MYTTIANYTVKEATDIYIYKALHNNMKEKGELMQSQTMVIHIMCQSNATEVSYFHGG
jgi:hypothetical protein